MIKGGNYKKKKGVNNSRQKNRGTAYADHTAFDD
jgi:hypothetical protein